MPTYSCEKCGKQFSQKSHYTTHLKKKKPCVDISDKINLLIDKKVKEELSTINIDTLKKLILDIENNKKYKNLEIDTQENSNIISFDHCDMNTFKDLYVFLQSNPNTNILEWLNESWVGKDKQESLLRLFAGLGLIDKLKSYDICKGNYNSMAINTHKSIKDVFYNDKGDLINLKDRGDASDLTGMCKENEKHLLLTTSKNLNKEQVGKLDIDKILTNFQKYKEKGYTMTLCVCIRDIKRYEIMKNNIESTNEDLKDLLEKEDTIIIDWNDLNQAYHQFKIIFGQKSMDNIINTNKTTLCLKMHQLLSVMKTYRMKNLENKNNILWGHIQRSGKSYIIAGCIIKDSKNKDECNYLVITTAPKETLEQQRKVFDCIQLTDFNIIVLNGGNKNPKLTKKNIILCSKQFLQTKIENKKEEKTTSIPWLKKMNFDMRFIDESHNGGTTSLAKKTLDYYGKKSFTVQITATYSKPINDYDIPNDSWILWDLEDIKLCKNIKDEGSVNRLIEKHGECIKDILDKFSLDNIISEYSKYPSLHTLTLEIKTDIASDIKNETRDNNYGWSTEACFLLKQGVYKDKETGEKTIKLKCEFQNEKENLKLWYMFFGKKSKLGIPDKEYPDDIVFMKRIEKICKNPMINSRFIGEGGFKNEPMIIMAFLPQNNINEISKATIKLLIDNNVCPDYEVISINSKTTNNPKQFIENTRNKARISNKKGVLVLSGKQCSMGVSINNCDIVLLLNNNMSFDMNEQMKFRCMTEGKNKKCGFVVDYNVDRAIDSLINYGSLIKPDNHPREGIKYILQEKLLTLNADHWIINFGHKNSKINSFSENIYNVYSSKTEKALNHFLNRLRFKEILLTKEEQQIFNAIFSNTTPTKIQKELIDKLLEEDEEKEKIKKGIEKTKVDTEDNTEKILEIQDNDIEKEEKQINYMDILKHIIPLICLLTIHDKETSFVEMFELIEKNEYVYNILIDQTKSWWGKSIDSKIIKKFINVYMKYMKDDKETNQIIRTVKELFMKNIKNNRELSNLIDKYLIPQELEKKSNAEVSTPFKLRQEMLDKIPVEFWTSIKKVFEPCAGKGGFIVDIIDRFMIGLEKTIPDEKERYRTIVEECLYFSDINPTNIFICKLLIDPYNEYKLNYNEGNTLELDIKEKWDIDGFDAVIGNPPYQGTGRKKLYINFIVYSLNNLYHDGVLLFITPQLAINFIIGNEISQQKIDKLYDIKYINVSDNIKKLHFKNIGSDFAYYYVIKNKYKNTTNIVYKNNKEDIINISFNSIISFDNSTHNKILNKLINTKNNEWGRKAARIDKNLKHNIEGKHLNKIVYKIKTNEIEYRYTDKTHNDFNKFKVLYPTLGNNYIIDKDKNLFPGTSFVVYIPCLSLKECNNILILKDSNIFKYLNNIFSNQRSPIDYIWRNLIKPAEFNIDINNENDIYKYFNLTEEEIKIIEESI